VIKGDAYSITLGNIPKKIQNHKFSLLQDNLRNNLIYDFLEAEKCYFLTHFNFMLKEPK